MSTRQFGEPIARNADAALLRGEGSFIDDIDLPGVLHAAFARSMVARARIRSVDVSAAEAVDGVVKVYTCDNIGALDAPLPLLIPAPDLTHPKTQRPLARDDVFYVGQCIAMVVAVNRYIAEDAVRLIDIDYDPLPVEMDLEKAVEDNAPHVHPDVPNNTAGSFCVETGDTDAAFAQAEHITRVKIRLERSTAAPLECRAIAARWEAVTGELTVWDGTQATLSVRGGLASLFRIDEDKVRVIAPNVGGGFGQKIMMFHPRRSAGAAGLDGARAPGQVHRGQGRELHRRLPGAHADPHPRNRGHEGRPRNRPQGRLPARHRGVHSLRHRGRPGELDLDRGPPTASRISGSRSVQSICRWCR